jgi:hypothetical protein
MIKMKKLTITSNDYSILRWIQEILRDQQEIEMKIEDVYD